MYRSLPGRLEEAFQEELDLDFSLRQVVAEAGEHLAKLTAEKSQLEAACKASSEHKAKLQEDMVALQLRSHDLSIQKVGR